MLRLPYSIEITVPKPGYIFIIQNKFKMSIENLIDFIIKFVLLFYHKLDQNSSTDFKFYQKISFRLRFITMQSLKLPPITP